MQGLGARIPTSFKRMAELQSIHRDATTGGLDIPKLFSVALLCPSDDVRLLRYCYDHKIAHFIL
jgi:hypothetical protein